MGVTRKAKHAKFPEKQAYHTYVCVSGGKKCSFLKIWRALFSCNTHFKIYRFSLLPTSSMHAREA